MNWVPIFHVCIIDYRSQNRLLDGVNDNEHKVNSLDQTWDRQQSLVTHCTNPDSITPLKYSAPKSGPYKENIFPITFVYGNAGKLNAT